MSPRARHEAIRKRAVALGLIDDEGPEAPGELERFCDQHDISPGDLADELEGLLDSAEE